MTINSHELNIHRSVLTKTQKLDTTKISHLYGFIMKYLHLKYYIYIHIDELSTGYCLITLVVL